MKLDTVLALTDLPSMPAAAKAAEAIGFDGLWTAETSHDPFFPLVLAGEHTARVKLGTAIAVAFPRSPMIVANIAWDLAQYTKGRFILGLGTQIRAHNEKRFSVPYDKPGPKLRDMILALRAIFDCWQNGTKLRYEGEYFRHTLMTPFFNPGPIDYPDIPIYVAGVNPYICRLVGELCQGFHVHPLHSIKYLSETVFPNITAGAEKSGRTLADIEKVCPVFTVFGDTEEEVEAAKVPIKQQIAFYASTPAYYNVLECHGWGDLGPKLTVETKKGNWSEIGELITDDMLDEFAVVGTTDTIAQKVVERYQGVVDRVLFYYPFLPGTDEDRWRERVEVLHAAGT